LLCNDRRREQAKLSIIEQPAAMLAAAMAAVMPGVTHP